MTLKSISLGVLSSCFVSMMYAQDVTTTSLNVEEASVEEVSLSEDSSLVVSDEMIKKVRPEGKGWFFEAGFGWGMPFLPTNMRSPLAEIGDKDWYQRGKRELSVKSNFGTNGGGWAANFTIGHMFHKNVGLDGTFTVAKHPERLDARIDIVGYTATQRTSTNAVYFAPHLVVRSNKGKFGVTAKAGLFIPIYGSTVSYANIKDKSGRMMQSLMGLPLQPLAGGILDLSFKAKTITSYNPTIGVSTSISLDYLVNDRVRIFAQARVGAYTISLKETKFEELQLTTKLFDFDIYELGQLKTNIQSIDEAPEFLSRIIYRKEITHESNTARYGGKVDLNKPMEEIGQKYNASSLYFNIGVNFAFDRFEKRSARKASKSETPQEK